jgi:geranylgeranyl pyrophosphate synthase
LWKIEGANYAVLMGDLLYCTGLSSLLKGGSECYAALFVQKVQEVCRAEIHQELVSRGAAMDFDAYMKIVREKTGPFFAFLGYVCGNDDYALSKALESAGYLTGTAYQLADDLLDIIGNETVAGKTLGTDAVRHKSTLAAAYQGDGSAIMESIQATMGSALAALERWPGYHLALSDFFANDLQPVFDKCLYNAELSVKIA